MHLIVREKVAQVAVQIYELPVILGSGNHGFRIFEKLRKRDVVKLSSVCGYLLAKCGGTVKQDIRSVQAD
jgi:hypothetical protein